MKISRVKPHPKKKYVKIKIKKKTKENPRVDRKDVQSRGLSAYRWTSPLCPPTLECPKKPPNILTFSNLFFLGFQY